MIDEIEPFLTANHFTQFHLEPKALFSMLGRASHTVVRLELEDDWPQRLRGLPGRCDVAVLIFSKPDAGGSPKNVLQDRSVVGAD